MNDYRDLSALAELKADGRHLSLDAGDRVTTPGGPGSVVYRRMAPPSYSEAAVYSVRLDSRAGDPRYSGTIYPAGQVKAES